jgi:protein SCO1/2
VSMRRAGLLACGVALLAAGCGGHTSAQSTSTAAAPHAHTVAPVHGTPVAASVDAQDFALRDHRGKIVRLSGQQGRVVLLTFLYTRCPDVCPLLAANLNAVLRSLSPKQRSGVRVIAISVDPAHDTQRAVGAFARSHALLPQFRYLVGSKSELQPVWQGYNLVVQPRNAEETEHSAYVLLIDRTGTPRMTYPSSVVAATVLRDLRRLALT